MLSPRAISSNKLLPVSVSDSPTQLPVRYMYIYNYTSVFAVEQGEAFLECENNVGARGGGGEELQTCTCTLY